MDRIKRSLKNINGRLFLALLVMGLCPTLYTTLRTFFLGQLPGDWSYSIAGQLSWVNLLYEVINEAIILPLYCIYVGKASSFYVRTFSKDGHIHKFLRYKETNGKLYSEEFVVRLIDNLQKNKCSIYVKCLEIVDYYDKSFSRAAHRLAFAELYWITKYQNMGECLDQLPEGVGSHEENYWKNNYSL